MTQRNLFAHAHDTHYDAPAAPLTLVEREPLTWRWVVAKPAVNRATVRYAGWLIETHDEDGETRLTLQDGRAVVRPKTFTPSEPAGVVAWRVLMRGDRVVKRLPYSARTLARRAALGLDVPAEVAA
jgi:hypothetical protein